ncbi:hypothetical protein C2E23DRAFT_590350 [Lenzites betulinus]|nr:hypothetical protein C2E23DRAFT_590350 [Lenzites betulinus]
MFSFSTIAVFATLAFSALTSALPNVVDRSAAVPEVARAVAAQDTVALIFNDAQTQLLPFTNQLKFATKQNATVEGLTPAINGIQGVLTSTTTRIHGLRGKPAEIILLALDGTVILTVAEVAKIIASVLILVFDALAAVKALLGLAIAPAVFLLLVGVGNVVGTLLQAVTLIVGAVLIDLTTVLVPLLGSVIGIIQGLGLTLILTLLGLL